MAGWRHRRRLRAELYALNDRMLKDIGISRADLNDAFSTPFWEDPTTLLSERAIEARLDRALKRPAVRREPAVEPGFTRPALNRPARHAV